MEPPRRCRRIAAAIVLCLVAALISTVRADGFMPGEWNGKWVSEFGNSSGKLDSQIYPSASNVTGAITLTNSPCTDETPLTGTLQQGALTLSISCSGCFFTFTSIDLQSSPVTGKYDIYCGGHFYDQGSFSFDYSGPWQNPTDYGNGWWSTWIGFFNAGNAPWIYHQTLGWLYLYESSTDSAWFWDPQWDGRGGWWWTSASLFPWIYTVTENEWLYLDAKDSTPGVRWFFTGPGQASTH